MIATTTVLLSALAVAAVSAAGCDGAAKIENQFWPGAKVPDLLAKYSIDCAAKTITWTVSANTTGWMGIAWVPVVDAMNGQEAVQMRIKSDGSAEARSVYAIGNENFAFESDKQALTAVAGKLENGVMTVSFTKAWTGAHNKTLPFAPGTLYAYNAATHRTNSDWDVGHQNRTHTRTAFDIFDKPETTTQVPITTLPATTAEQASTSGGATSAAAVDCTTLKCDDCVKTSGCAWCDSLRAGANATGSSSTASSGSCATNKCTLGSRVQFTDCKADASVARSSIATIAIVALLWIAKN